MTDTAPLRPHPCAEIFPTMDDKTFGGLVADMAKNGQREPIIVDQHNRIVDGVHRYRACVKLEMQPKITHKTFTDGEAMRFSVSGNLHRRHLSQGQCAAIAAELTTCSRGGNQAANLPNAVTQAQAATMMHTSERAVRTAAKVKKHRPDLHERVKAGLITLHIAEREVNEGLGGPSASKNEKRKSKLRLSACLNGGEAAIPSVYAPLFNALDELPQLLVEHPLLSEQAKELLQLLAEAISQIEQSKRPTA